MDDGDLGGGFNLLFNLLAEVGGSASILQLVFRDHL